MIWQDFVITVGGVVLTISMLPTLLNRKSQVPFWSSFPTAIILFPFFSWVFMTLNTPLSAITIGVEGMMWWFILFFRRVKKVVETTNDEPENVIYS